MDMHRHPHLPHAGHEHGSELHPRQALKDPVCGMTVNDASPHRATTGGVPTVLQRGLPRQVRRRSVALCWCPRRGPAVAQAGPKRPRKARSTPARCTPRCARTIPGNCPKCGMALEPEMPSLDEGENPELADFRRRFWWTLPLTVDRRRCWRCSAIACGCSTMATQSWVELVLSAPVVLWAGWPFFVRGVQSVVNRSPNMWTLIGLGTSAAFVYSVVATVAPGVFPGLVRVDGTGRRLLRGGGGDHLADAARPVARAEGALADLGGDQVAARPGAEDRAAHQRRRQRRGRSADPRPRRRLAARAPGREGAGRRRRSSKAAARSTNRC